MQKVEGSNPFSRSPESPTFAGLSAFPGRLRDARLGHQDRASVRTQPDAPARAEGRVSFQPAQVDQYSRGAHSFSGARAAPDATIVYSLSAEADALSDCPKQNGLHLQAFHEAAEGIRTLDLLHGKQ